jgi:hypothetical protein
MTTDNFYFYLQNRLIQTSRTGGQWYSDTSPIVFPGDTMLVTTIAILHRLQVYVCIAVATTLA